MEKLWRPASRTHLDTHIKSILLSPPKPPPSSPLYSCTLFTTSLILSKPIPTLTSLPFLHRFNPSFATAIVRCFTSGTLEWNEPVSCNEVPVTTTGFVEAGNSDSDWNTRPYIPVRLLAPLSSPPGSLLILDTIFGGNGREGRREKEVGEGEGGWDVRFPSKSCLCWQDNNWRWRSLH